MKRKTFRIIPFGHFVFRFQWKQYKKWKKAADTSLSWASLSLYQEKESTRIMTQGWKQSPLKKWRWRTLLLIQKAPVWHAIGFITCYHIITVRLFESTVPKPLAIHQPPPNKWPAGALLGCWFQALRGAQRRGGGSLIWTVPAMQNKGKWLKNRGGHLLGRSFRAPPGGQLFGHGYASGHGSLIRGVYLSFFLFFLPYTF